MILAPAVSADPSGASNTVVVQPETYEGALRNPLKGFRDENTSHEYATLNRVYLKWNELERRASDGLERIKRICNRKWGDVEKHNMKVIPRVYLHWEGEKTFWPEDMETGDYSSEQFRRRVVRLVDRLGQAWDDDPRVAWVQMGIIGKWGEHHSPSIPPDMQKLLGRAFTRAFENKMVTVRHPWDFQNFTFGIYWDSWAHVQQMEKHGGGIETLGDRWKRRPIGGETAYNWGRYQEQPGDNPSDTLRDPEHRRFLINTIRRLHCNNLGWVANYDQDDPEVRAGAEKMQKAFGYRFVLEEVRYPSSVRPGQSFDVSFDVRNTGSTPFYYDWPVALSLLDPASGDVVWRDTFDRVDLRAWLPGDDWNPEKQVYRREPERYSESGRFRLPREIEQGTYLLTLSILDPAGRVPSARFAVRNYRTGGHHPIGRIGVGEQVDDPQLSPDQFDDPQEDRTLHYEGPQGDR